VSASILQKLRLNAAFRDWPVSEVAVFAEACQLRSLRQGVRLCEEGKSGAVCWLILDGALEVLRRVGGRQVTVARFGAGEWVGQVALLDGAPRSGTVEAATDAEVLILSRDIFTRLLESHAPAALRFQRQMALTGAHQVRIASEQLAALTGTVARRGRLSEEDLAEVRRRRSRTNLRPTQVPASWLPPVAATDALRAPTALPPHKEPPPSLGPDE
jgi:CRP-like cAMP-binding protein